MQIRIEKPLIESLPDPASVRLRLGNALREVELLRRLLRLASLAETFRVLDSEVDKRGKVNAT